jgi:hypothetical protein
LLVCKGGKGEYIGHRNIVGFNEIGIGIGQSSRTLLSDSLSSVSVVSNSCYICMPGMVGGTWVVLVGKPQLLYDFNLEGGQGSKVYLDKQVVFVVFLAL